MHRYDVVGIRGKSDKTGEEMQTAYAVVDSLDMQQDRDGAQHFRIVAAFHYENTRDVERALAQTQAKAYAQLLEIIR